jgi:DNA-directed RNA polymerase subunit omega|tara:strand:- start:1971 stop:2222 length:252 start_codon:yes stop_codon:yes gene_type:complete
MARITIEDCLNHTPNRFALVCVAAQRAYDLVKGAPPEVVCNNKEAVTSLREVAAGKVSPLASAQHAHVNVLPNKSRSNKEDKV